MRFIRENFEDMAIVAIIILVGLDSFGLGRLSVQKRELKPLRVLSPQTTNEAESSKSNL